MKTKVWIGILAGVFALCLGLSFLLLMPGEGALQAEIYSDGVLVKTVDLRIDTTFTIETEFGVNEVTVRDGKIAVTAADCPDHYCMDRGFCNSGAMIVCLPNKLVIQFSEGAEVDGAVG